MGPQIDKDVEPVVQPLRKIPETLRSKLKDELEKMEQSGVISKVNEPTPWVNSSVAMKNNLVSYKCVLTLVTSTKQSSANIINFLRRMKLLLASQEQNTSSSRR